MTQQPAGELSGPEPKAAATGSPPTAGVFITETLFEFDHGRQVTVYVPPNPPEAIVFAGDGPGIAQWGEVLESLDLPPTMIVGVHGLSDEMSRLQEYSPVFDADRFAAHEQFFVDEVRRWVTSRFGVTLPSERTAVFGYSAGGELALALGIRHPDIFGAILSGSPGAGYEPPSNLAPPLPRVFLFGGTLEPFFLDNAKRWANALRDAGVDVALNERNFAHGPDQWRSAFPGMVEWAFPR